MYTASPISSNKAMVDSFGRQRVSNPFTIFDSKQISDNQPLFWDEQEVSGSGTSSVYNSNRASTTMSVAANTAGHRVRQTYRRFNYQPGKSQKIDMTAIFHETPSGIRKALGQFDDNNGIYFENDGGTFSVCIRSNATGSAVDTKIPQSSWNVDKMNGNGPSGVFLDTEKSQIYSFDYEWLAVGSVRFFIFIDAIPYLIHIQNHANKLDVVYMSTPNNPLRYEIENSGTGPESSFELICSAIASEGGQDIVGISTAISRGSTVFTSAATNGVIYPLLSIRLKDSHLGTQIDLDGISVINTTNGINSEILVICNPTIAGTDAASWVPISNSSIEYDISRDSTNLLTGGEQIYQTYLPAGGFLSGDKNVESVFRSVRKLGVSITGVKDEIVLAARKLDGNAGTYYGGINFTELS